jgi:hypothetical protein
VHEAPVRRIEARHLRDHRVELEHARSFEPLRRDDDAGLRRRFGQALQDRVALARPHARGEASRLDSAGFLACEERMRDPCSLEAIDDDSNAHSALCEERVGLCDAGVRD